MGRLVWKDFVLEVPSGTGRHGRRAADMQELTNLLCRRLYWLDEQDRLLLTMIYERGSSCRQIASILKLRTSSVSRRIHKLTRRLLSRDYPICLSHRSELSSLQLKIARDRFVADLSRHAIARRHRISVYRVDFHLHHLNRLITRHKEESANKKFDSFREGA